MCPFYLRYRARQVEIIGQSMKTESADSLLHEIHDRSCINMVGHRRTVARARASPVAHRSTDRPDSVPLWPAVRSSFAAS
jgi:hypothetical protein